MNAVEKQAMSNTPVAPDASSEFADLPELSADALEDLAEAPTDHGAGTRRADPPLGTDAVYAEGEAGVLVGAPESEPIVFRRHAPPSVPPETTNPRFKMAKLDSAMKEMRDVDGYIAAGIVDTDSGMALASESSGGFDIEAACAANTDVVRAKLKAMKALGLGEEAIEDILITLGSQYHLIRPLKNRPSVFCYLAVDRARANLAMSRLTLGQVEANIQL
jgi:predicted regulator of Ras-like GTPase activity (Roadblock/LC7/MglB family)